MKKAGFVALGLVIALGNSLGCPSLARAEAEEASLNQLTCQAVNTLGTAGIGLGTQGEVLIQTTSVVGVRTDRYSIGNITRTLENSKGSLVHLVNKDENQPGVLLKFSRELPEELTRLEGYLYSVSPKFNAAADKAPLTPVAYVSCSIQL